MLNKKVCTEIYYIISQLSDEMRKKIPKEIQDNFEQNIDYNHIVFLRNNDIEDVELLEETEKILSVLYTDYLSTPEERKVILEKEKLLKMKSEINKKRQYDKNSMFGNRGKVKENKTKSQEDLIKVERNNILKKISEKIKNFFKIFFD